ncbi:MAG: hypothetical protein IJF67_13610 [Clostridia bacterium]|nr:hypothetical protein [Clostridia bacterium]
MKRNLSALLLIAMLAGLASCGGKTPGAGSADTTLPPDETTAAVDNTPEIFKQGLDFGGETITFLYRADAVNEFYVAESTGDIVDDALFESRTRVEEALNVKLEIVERSWLDTGRAQYTNHIAETVMAGDDVYDWVDQIADEWYKLVPQGLMVDLKDHKYIDLSQPWWNAGLQTDANIGGGIFYLVGDYALGYLKDTYCIYFNKELANTVGAGDLYGLVRDGKWTIDKALEISAKAVQDLNGDGNFTMDDRMGFVMHDKYHLPGFIAACEVDMMTGSGDDWKLTIGTERDHAIVEQLNKLLFESPGNYMFPASRTSTANMPEYQKITAKFVSGDILFLTSQMHDAVTDLRDMKADYGILPFPKYEESQKAYHTFSRSTHAVIGMPVTCPDYDRAGAVLEAIACVNHETVVPVYFETALKVKYSRDDESAEMYDLILAGSTLNFGYLNKNCMYGTVTPPVELFIDGAINPGSFISSVAAARDAGQKKLDEYITAAAEYAK